MGTGDLRASDDNATGQRLVELFIHDTGANLDANVANTDVRICCSYQPANLRLALLAEATP